MYFKVFNKGGGICPKDAQGGDRCSFFYEYNIPRAVSQEGFLVRKSNASFFYIPKHTGHQAILAP